MHIIPEIENLGTFKTNTSLCCLNFARRILKTQFILELDKNIEKSFICLIVRK